MQELSLNILDIAQNSIVAKATLIEILLTEKTTENTLEIIIADNGSGMSEEQVKNVTDPFYTTRTTRKIGLGVPFFKMAAEMTGGEFDITSKLNKGTRVRALFKTNHIDCMPLGNIRDTMFSLVTLNGDVDFIYKYDKDGEAFELDTRQFREILGDIPFNTPEVMLFIRDYLNN